VENADVEGLASVPELAVDLCAAVRAAGLDSGFLARLARIGERLDEPMRAPMRAWNASSCCTTP
jgi:hypothetical protein